jgi:hypothetical protein
MTTDELELWRRIEAFALDEPTEPTRAVAVVARRVMAEEEAAAGGGCD